jgi:predicted RNase H-like HicB family nuclease
MKDYHVNVSCSDEDEGYIADIPDLRHCSAFGAMPQEVLAEVLKAKDARIKAAKAARKPITSPSFRPAIYQIA